MTLLLQITAGVLLLAALLVLVRLVRGPSTLDRALAGDVLIVIVVGAMAAQIAHSDDPAPLPVLIVFSLVGFVGSVSIARSLDRQEDEG